MNRRTILKSAATLAAASGFAPAAKASHSQNSNNFNALTSRNRDRSKITSSLAPWAPSAQQPWDTHTIGHLYRRAGFGATVAEIYAAASSPNSAIEALLDNTLLTDPKMPPLPRYAAEKWYGKAPYLGNDYDKRLQQQAEYSYGNMEIRRQWGVIMSQPETMLREKMALFWMNHFAVESSKVYFPQLMHRYLDYFRHNAWGNFKQMVKDVTIQGAMLYYLDGYISRRTAPNENYARELQELFTLGVTDKDGNPNYSENDIRAIAKALTGYTIDFTSAAPNVIATYYDVNQHDASLKTVYGVTKPWGLGSAGIEDDIIDHILTARADQTAWFICSKLYQYFVYHDISGPVERGIIDQMAATFKSSNWDVRAVLAELLKSEHFFDEANIGAAIKSPYEHVIGMARQFDLPLNELQSGSLYYYTIAGGQQLLDPPNVKGWPGYRSWISTTTLPLRNGIGTLLVVNKSLPAVGADGYGNNHQPVNFTDAQVTAWAKQFTYSATLEEFVDSLIRFLCAQPASQKTIDGYILAGLSYDWTKLDDTGKAGAIRTIVNRILSLADYQLA